MKISLDTIIQMTAFHHDMTRAELIGPGQKHRYSHARHLGMWIADWYRNDLSRPYITRRFGKKDHSTLYHALNRVEKLINAGDMDTINLLNRICVDCGFEPCVPYGKHEEIKIKRRLPEDSLQSRRMKLYNKNRTYHVVENMELAA